MTRDEQLKLWLSGQPEHNPDTDQCCPDYSCCTGLPVQAQGLRRRYIAAYKEGDRATMTALQDMFFAVSVMDWLPDTGEGFIWGVHPEPTIH